MIRVNLLTVERARAKKPVVLAAGQKITIGCSLMLILAGLFIGWRYLTVARDSAKLDVDITRAQEETTRLHAIIQQVQQFEQRRGQLQQRVVLIEQLRSGQAGPVHMLDQISRALPPMLWLTELKQVGGDVIIDGNSLALTSLSDFVANLEASGYFKRSVEIVNTTTETLAQPPGQLIKFTIRAQFVPPATPKPAAPAPPQKAGG